MAMKVDSTKLVKLIRTKTSSVMSMARVMVARRTRQGIGVRLFTFSSAMEEGMWPQRAPTKKRRLEAKMPPFTAPKVEQATNSGIHQRITPNIELPKV